MTDIDPRADIEIHPAGAGVTVRMPLAGPVPGGWLQCYQQLALARGMSVQGQAHDDRAWVVVHVPVSSDPAEVAAMLDDARALIADADAQWPPATTTAEASVRDWWAASRDSASRGPGSGTKTASARADSPADLLKTGFLVWFYTIIAFTFLYWLLDGGGPESRFLAPREFPELAFPPQLNPGVAPPGWRPEFFDYLYLGFTDATAFSPTDVMPLTRWAKLAMTVQAVSSLMILGLVIARAVNILQ
jgi:hypothetical protein